MIMFTQSSCTAVNGACPKGHYVSYDHNPVSVGVLSLFFFGGEGGGRWSRTSETGRRKVDYQGDCIDCELELDELLDVDVDGTPPLGDGHDGGEVVVKDDHVGTFLRHLVGNRMLEREREREREEYVPLFRKCP